MKWKCSVIRGQNGKNSSSTPGVWNVIILRPRHARCELEYRERALSQYAEGAATREEVDFIIGEMIGELNASHTYHGGAIWKTQRIKM